MKTLNDYLEALKAKKGWKHDADVWRFLGLAGSGHLADIKKGKQHISLEHATMIAIELDEDPTKIMMCERIQHAKDEAEKKAWQRYFEHYYGVAAAVLLTSAVTFVLCHQSPESPALLASSPGALFIM